jgi:uncharacterized protein (TIGR02421 family)
MNRSPRPDSIYGTIARNLGDRLLAIVKPIRVLDAVRWDESVEESFLAQGGRELPVVTYSALPFDPVEKRRGLIDLEREVRLRLGSGDLLGRLLARRCRQAYAAVDLLASRGSSDFSRLSGDYYGRPTPAEIEAVDGVFAALRETATPAPIDRVLDATTAADCLVTRLGQVFRGTGRFRVRLDARVQSDAAASGRTIKLRRDAHFSLADLAALEVHEGWAHIGTTLNARRQPVCSFLTQGPPATTSAQEGLAVLCEILAGVCHADRVGRLHSRFQAVQMAENGADFLDVYRYFLAETNCPRDAYHQSARIFRGSQPAGAGPFAKDRTYALGLVRLLRFAHSAQRAGNIRRLQLMFIGKLTLSDLPVVASLAKARLVTAPVFLPPPFDNPSDLAAKLHHLPHPPHRMTTPKLREKSLRITGNEASRPLSFKKGTGYEWRETG